VQANVVVLGRLAERLSGLAKTMTPGERRALGAVLTLAEGDHALTALRATGAEAILDPGECAVFDQAARARPAPADGETARLLVVVMKATRRCNLRCTYCHFWREGPDSTMPFDVLVKTTRDALAVPGVRTVEFVWHGGEVTLLSPGFLEKAIWLQEQFRQPGQLVTNTVQSNGTRLTKEWLDVLARYEVSVGLSLDGPPEVHDQRRVDAAGKPTSARVAAGLARLRARGIAHGVLLVVDQAVVEVGAQRLLDYLVEVGVGDVALLNAIPENSSEGAPVNGTYLPWPDFVAWLRELFAAWWPQSAGRVTLRELDDLVGIVRGERPTTCVTAGECHGTYLTIEPNGDVSACDKYVDDPEFALGSLRDATITQLLAGAHLARVRRVNAAAVERLRGCEWFERCNGGCPHDRRLNERYQGGVEGCCGLRPLLEDIATALAQQGAVDSVQDPTTPARAKTKEELNVR
jgi:uncharacterized protein